MRGVWKSRGGKWRNIKEGRKAGEAKEIGWRKKDEGRGEKKERGGRRRRNKNKIQKGAQTVRTGRTEGEEEEN